MCPHFLVLVCVSWVGLVCYLQGVNLNSNSIKLNINSSCAEFSLLVTMYNFNKALVRTLRGQKNDLILNMITCTFFAAIVVVIVSHCH